MTARRPALVTAPVTAFVITALFLFAVALHRDAWRYIVESAHRVDRFDLCVIALLLTGYFIWRRQARFRLRIPNPVGAGLVLLVGLAFSQLGYRLEIEALSHGAALLSAAGIILLALHPEGRPDGLIATGGLMFTLPIPGKISDILTPILQTADARIVEFTMRALDYDAVRQGNRVFTETAVIAIEQSCNGLMLLWPILVSAYIGFWLNDDPVAKRARIIASLGIVAVGVNLVRLLGISFAYLWLPEGSADTVHTVLGYGTMIGFGVLPLVLLDSALGRPVAHRAETQAQDPGADRITGYGRWRRTLVPACFAAMVASVLIMATPQPAQTAHVPIPLPVAFDGWVGEDMAVTQEELNILNPSALSKRRYVSMDNPDYEIILLVALYDDRDAAGSHSADRCFAALGWSMVSNISRQMPDRDQVAVRDIIRMNAETDSFAVSATENADNNNVQEYVFQRLQFRQRVFETVLPMAGASGQVARIQLVLPAYLGPYASDSLLLTFSDMVTEVSL